MDFHSFTSEDLAMLQRNLKRNGNIVFKNIPALGNTSLYQISTTDSSILVRKKEHDFYRLYVCSNDENDLKCALCFLNDETYLLNIPTKEDITQHRSLLEACGFEICGTYGRYYNKNIIKREDECGTLATSEDINDIKDMLYSTFSTYTDYIPSLIELQTMIVNQQILVNRFENGKVGGFVIFTIERGRGYINAWLDQTGNGIPLMYKTYNIFESKGVNYVNFWINSQNKNVIVLHKMMGAKPDGLIDYTFIKKQ